MLKRFVARYVGQCLFVLFTALSIVGIDARAQSIANADALLAIDQQRASVVERIVAAWGPTLSKSKESVSIDELRSRLLTLRADQLFAASLAGTEDGLRELAGYATAKPSLTQAAHTKALGDAAADVVYTPVTPCRLVDTRGTFAAVYQGNGTASHTPIPFAPNEIRSYTVQGGNGVCLTQLPAGLNPSAVQLQVFGMPTTSASGDIEILPQGATFGSTATIVYVASINFNTVSTAAKINTADKQISVQVRGGGAHLAIDVVGYFAAPSGNGGKFLMQGGNAFGTMALLGTVDNQPLTVLVNNTAGLRLAPATDAVGNTSVNVIGGFVGNVVDAGIVAATVGGGGFKRYDNASFANHVAKTYGTIAGGISNSVIGEGGTVAGGTANTVGDYATITGGTSNTASGTLSVVAGGFGGTASGDVAFVAGGSSNTASGNGSFAAGHDAAANQDNCALFGLWSSSGQTSCFSTPYVFKVMGDNGFSVDYGSPTGSGGGTKWLAIGPYTNYHGIVPSTIIAWNGAYLSDAGVWVNASSSKFLKTDFDGVDVSAVLRRVVGLPITTWRYKQGEGSVRHMGPMAEDFWNAFHIGYGDKTIADLDARGIEFAAIQGLHKLVLDKDAKIDAQQHEIAELRTELDAVKRAVAQFTSGNAHVAMHESP